MIQNPPPLQNQAATDRQQINLLAIFHFVVAALALLAIGGLAAHYFFMSMFFDNPELWKNARNPPPPEMHVFFGYFKYFYIFGGVMALLFAVANLLSGFFLRARTNRMFSLVVAGLNCIQLPFGTVLGVLTIVVLIRESVRQLYEGGPVVR